MKVYRGETTLDFSLIRPFDGTGDEVALVCQDGEWESFSLDALPNSGTDPLVAARNQLKNFLTALQIRASRIVFAKPAFKEQYLGWTQT